ncbi:ANTAR domain-containing protein [Nocardioides baculatus]|uniref:ANTAR domain-containing protein n=1 Tax=Nocardioides baculatus TaxID=2801337 RepID=A0ABS1LBQ7_9ACTN|nr:ANTAR domain-containing protein [Nocardioides baculatus]MBL0749109.1 ANTAR domain-containing protein [Nocardioides baculatus]
MNDQYDDLQRQIDQLVAQVKSNRDDIQGLTERADAADLRADAARDRADDLEARSVIDRELIAELHTDGVVRQEHVAELEAALASSRTIGAALGILMASRNIGQAEALTVLKETSQRTNTKLRDLAATLVNGTEVSA